jgi:diguanylate cyclase (GGDEF)-like protein
MQAPRIPLDETKRLRALTTLCLLDTLPEEKFDRVTRLACRTFNVPIATVSLVDRERQWFKSKQGLEACETSRSLSICGHAILNEAQLVVPDAALHPYFADNPLVTGDPFIRFYAGQPVHGPDGSRVGTLCIIDRQPRLFTPEDGVILADLGAMVDRELSLIEHATVDDLTRLSNRRGFAMVAKHVLALCRRNRQPAVVIAFDLDHFKTINDQRGHDAGDHVLRQFSKLLHSHFRNCDVVARLGGDEFTVLCGGANYEQMMDSLQRLKLAFDESELAKNHPHLSWSAGLASYDPRSEQTIEELLRMADARMYCAKAEGRQKPVRAQG